MKLLVTGSNGFLGSALVARLLARGHTDIRCMVRPGSARARLEALAEQHPGGIEYFTGTLSRPDDCQRAVDGVDAVYHLAAATGGAPADMFLNSAVATKNLLEAMVDTGRRIHLVYVSSFAAYGVADLPRGTVVDERTPIEPHPERRDPYSHTKLRQEQVVWQYHREKGIPTVVLRPGVIYGPGGSPMSTRVGLNLFGLFLHLGRSNLLPLTYVDNCAEAVALVGERAARDPALDGEVYNVVDDDLITAKDFLARYRKAVRKVPYVTLPYAATRLMSLAVERYHHFSKGQLPAVFTRYKSDTMWKGNRFDNGKLKALGWQQLVSTREGLERHFAHLRAQQAT